MIELETAYHLAEANYNELEAALDALDEDDLSHEDEMDWLDRFYLESELGPGR